MGLFFLPLLPLAVPYILGGLDFLRNTLFPPAPATNTVAPPFTPPFLNGQCNAAYRLKFQATIAGFNNAPSLIGTTDTFTNNGTRQIIGAVTNVAVADNGVQWNATVTDSLGSTTVPLIPSEGNPTNFQRYSQPFALEFVLASGGSDNCGNVPNPNPPLPVSGDGIANSDSPDIDADGLKIVEGLPLAPLPSFGTALASALAAAVAAANALDAVREIANALDSLKDLLESLNDDAKEKDKDKKKDTFRYTFGSIRSDGFLRLYPDSGVNTYKAEQLDLNVLSIPLYYGRYFGRFSPNFYRFKSLGYIAFVSNTFGVLEYREIEFSRCSFSIPDDCIGFFYNLGLEGDIVANAWAYYTKPQED